MVVIGVAGLAALLGIAAGTADGENVDIAEAMGLHSGAIIHAQALQVSLSRVLELPRAWSGLSLLTKLGVASIKSS